MKNIFKFLKFKYLVLHIITENNKKSNFFELNRFQGIKKFSIYFKSYRSKFYRIGKYIIEYKFYDKQLDKLTKKTLKEITLQIRNYNGNIREVKNTVSLLKALENDNIEVVNWNENTEEANHVDNFIDEVYTKMKECRIKSNFQNNRQIIVR
jgi:hypothetical protein